VSTIRSSRRGARSIIRASVIATACCAWAVPGTALAGNSGVLVGPFVPTPAVETTSTNAARESATAAPELPASRATGEKQGAGQAPAPAGKGQCGEQTCLQFKHMSAHQSVVGWGKNATGGLGGGFRGAARGGVVGTHLENVLEVAAAGASYALVENGTVDSWGDNTFGELGNGTHENSSTPEPIPGLTNVVAIAAGACQAMALLSNGTVMTWGANEFDTAGNGTGGEGHIEEGIATPTLVPSLTNVVAIASGGGDDAALLANGTVEAWGENKAGQIGDGTTELKSVPTPVQGLTNVKSIAIGGIASIGGHLLAVLQSGTVMAVGGNFAGELGDDSAAKLSTTPVPVKGLSGVTEVSADISHSMALLENGTVMTWGSNTYGQLGVTGTHERCYGSPCSRVPVAVGLHNVTSISAGFRFSLAISSGKGFAWGWNQHHQLGQPGEETADHSLPMQVPGVNELAAVSAGEEHSLALGNGPIPQTPLEISPGAQSLTVHWFAGEEPQPWGVQWRLAGNHNKWSPLIDLPSQSRSYTITGLSVQPYEVLVRNKNFGSDIVRGTPLA
jgi:alpha-tubulin suppressor-like RCC1 family protein